MYIAQIVKGKANLNLIVVCINGKHRTVIILQNYTVIIACKTYGMNKSTYNLPSVVSIINTLTLHIYIYIYIYIYICLIVVAVGVFLSLIKSTTKCQIDILSLPP